MLFRRHKSFLPQTRDGRPLPKVRVSGRVGGVVACELLTVADEITVGSAVDNDLVLLDPLAPPRAFRLSHLKEHDDPKHVCHACWELHAFPGARVYVNNSLTPRERLAFGDVIAVGCHAITFGDGNIDQRDLLA